MATTPLHATLLGTSIKVSSMTMVVAGIFVGIAIHALIRGKGKALALLIGGLIAPGVVVIARTLAPLTRGNFFGTSVKFSTIVFCGALIVAYILLGRVIHTQFPSSRISRIVEVVVITALTGVIYIVGIDYFSGIDFFISFLPKW